MSELSDVLAEMRSNRETDARAKEEDRKEQKQDRGDLHKKIGGLETTMTDVRIGMETLSGDVKGLGDRVERSEKDIGKLQRRSSPSPEGPHSMRQVKEKVNDQSWRKIGGIITGGALAIFAPAYYVGSSMSATTTGLAEVQQQQRVVEKRATVSEADQIAALEAALEAARAQSASARALATLDDVEAEKAIAKADKAEKKIEAVGRDLEKRKMAAAAAEE